MEKIRYEVTNLLNDKKVILSREDIYKITSYAIESGIIAIKVDAPGFDELLDIKNEKITYMQKEIDMQKELTEEEKKENLATFGVEDPNVIEIDTGSSSLMTTEEYFEKNPPLGVPTFFSTQRD